MSGKKKGGDGWDAQVQVANAAADKALPGVVNTIYASDVGCTAVVQSRFSSSSADILRTSLGATLIRPDAQDVRRLSPQEAATLEDAMARWQASALPLKASDGPHAEVDEKALGAGIKRHGKLTIKTQGGPSAAMDDAVELPNLPGNPLQQLCDSKKPPRTR